MGRVRFPAVVDHPDHGVAELHGVFAAGYHVERGQTADRRPLRLPQQALSAFLSSVAQILSSPLEPAVLEQPGQQLVAGLLGRQLGLEERFGAGQQQPRLDLHQEAHEQQELAHLVPVGGSSLRLQLVQIRRDHLEQRHLQQVDLLFEDERQQEVERPLVDVEI